MENPPRYLYKIISLKNWQASQEAGEVILSSEDTELIHLSREDQLERILHKYWSNEPEYFILKLETAKLSGKLVFEANPGGINKYYHLYEGSIPLTSVVEAKQKHY